MSKRAIDISSGSVDDAPEAVASPTKRQKHDAPNTYVNYFLIFCDRDTALAISEEADLDLIYADSSDEEDEDEEEASSSSSSGPKPAPRRKRATPESDEEVDVEAEEEEEEESDAASSSSFVLDDEASEDNRASDELECASGEEGAPRKDDARIVCTLLATVLVDPHSPSHINTTPYADALLAATTALGSPAPTCRPLVELLLAHTNAESQAVVKFAQVIGTNHAMPSHARIVCAPYHAKLVDSAAGEEGASAHASQH